MEYPSAPKGICPKHMQFELTDGLIHGIKFVGGCAGNLAGISLLAEGRPAEEVAKMLAGVTCGKKKTSCPDQLSKAIMKALKSEKKSDPKAKTKAPSPEIPSFGQDKSRPGEKIAGSAEEPFTKLTVSTPLGPMTAAFLEEQLAGLWFQGQKHFPEKAAWWPETKDLKIGHELQKWLNAYFDGQNPTLELKLKTQGSEFQEAVWGILRKIPYGQCFTYGQISRLLAGLKGNGSQAAIAVGGAVGRNRISIAIPCHRVVGSKGDFVGYAGGLDRKKALLTLEGYLT
jgi:methylated-DNA-[protein]-cysteine S-methyltransferase